MAYVKNNACFRIDSVREETARAARIAVPPRLKKSNIRLFMFRLLQKHTNGTK